MKIISIITGSELRQVQGVNYFIKSFLLCNPLFKHVFVKRVYSSLQVLKVEEGNTMPIGKDSGTTEYVVRTSIRTFFRKMLTSRFYLFALFRYELNFYHNSKHSVNNYFKDNIYSDYILFQEFGCAYFYFKQKKGGITDNNPKTILVIHSEDDSGSMLLNNFSGFGFRDMYQRYCKRRDFVYKNIDKVVYISRKAYNNSILPENKRSFVYNGCQNIECDFSERQNDTINIVCVGSFSGRKGQDKIVEALNMSDDEHLNKIHVTFIGDGSELKNVVTLVKRYELMKYVSFMGRRNDVSKILTEMDVFIMPSTVEGLPMSAIEAMRAGLFLILTDTGGNAELCENGCGFVCTRDPQDILQKIYDVIDHPIISKSQKQQSKKRFLSSFTLDSMAKGYETILTEL